MAYIKTTKIHYTDDNAVVYSRGDPTDVSSVLVALTNIGSGNKKSITTTVPYPNDSRLCDEVDVSDCVVVKNNKVWGGDDDYPLSTGVYHV